MRLVDGADVLLLRVEMDSFRGAGAHRRSAFWHCLSPSGAVNLVYYPISGVVSGWCDFERQIKVVREVVPARVFDGALLEIEFEVLYSADPIQTGVGCELFSENSRLVLQWDSSGRVFVPATNSTMTANEVNAYFDDGHKEFAQRYLTKLLELRHQGAEDQREWTRRFAESLMSNEATIELGRRLA